MYQAGLINNWAKAIFDIIKNPNYPNAYTDLSCFSAYNYDTATVEDICNARKRKGKNKNHDRSIQKALAKFKIQVYDKLKPYEKGKILYGSDYFLIEFQGVEMKKYINDFEKVFGSSFNEIASKHSHEFLTEFKMKA